MEPAVTDAAAPADWLGAIPLLVAAADEMGLLLLLPVGTASAELAELALGLGLALGGVNGTVTLRPGSLVVWTLAAKFAKVLLPVVGALMDPYMLKELSLGLGWSKKRTRLPALAVRDATAEEPDGGRWVDNLQRVYTDLARSINEGKETGVKALLIGDSIELP